MYGGALFARRVRVGFQSCAARGVPRCYGARRTYAAETVLGSQKDFEKLQSTHKKEEVEKKTKKKSTWKPPKKLIHKIPIGKPLSPDEGAKVESAPLDENEKVERVPLDKGAKVESVPLDKSAKVERVPLNKSAKVKRIPLVRRSGMVYTTRPHAVTVDDLIRGLPLDEPSQQHATDQPALLVILLTPGLAKFALDGDLPAQVLNALNGRGPLAKPSNTYTAVVDALPFVDEGDESSEGMAYWFERDPQAVPEEPQQPLSRAAQKPGTLFFEIPSRYNGRTCDTTMQLPLAQTVFTTGLVSTLIHRHFGSSDASKVLPLLNEVQLESHKLRIPVTNTYSSIRHRIPLLPLTPFREIKYAMGNIVRQLSPAIAFPGLPGKSALPSNENSEDSSAEQVMPASQELEAAVAAYFKAMSMPPEAVDVWALVLPTTLTRYLMTRESKKVMTFAELDTDKIRASWTNNADDAASMASFVELLFGRFQKLGARLVHVISGGGGWGKKAGLLSLDPDTAYSTRELRQDDGWQFNFDNFDDGTEAGLEAQKKEALGQVVDTGEKVMFLLAPKQPTPMKTAPCPVFEDDKAGAIILGVIPSSIDFPSAAYDDTSPGAGDMSVSHVPDVFGMLSEGGMALRTVRRTNRKTVTHQTKLDIPFSRFSHLQTNIDMPNTRSLNAREQTVEARLRAGEDNKSSTRSSRRAERYQREASGVDPGDRAPVPERDVADPTIPVTSNDRVSARRLAWAAVQNHEDAVGPQGLSLQDSENESENSMK